MSESFAPLRQRRRLVQLWPLTMISLGVVLSLGWAGFLAWLLVRAFGGLI